MICLDCGKVAVEYVGNLALHNRTIGDFTVSDVTYQECPKCGEQFFSPETLDTIETTEKEIKESRIGRYPIADFIGADTAARILGISRQALHKNRRIQRSFIYSRRFDGKIAYLKKSVELFKETGDGRFVLVHCYAADHLEYVEPDVIPYSHFEVTDEIVLVSSMVSGSVEMSGMNICGVAKEDFKEFSEPDQRYCSDDENYNKLLEAA